MPSLRRMILFPERLTRLPLGLLAGQAEVSKLPIFKILEQAALARLFEFKPELLSPPLVDHRAKHA